MGRPVKNTAEYFPHFCGDGSTKFIINERFGNDGYAIWIKTLELLTVSENHIFDFNNPSKRLFLNAKMGVPDDTLQEIYLLFVQLGILDSELLKLGALWCDELVESLSTLYDRRKKQLPSKYGIYSVYGIKNKVNVNRNSINGIIKPQSKVEYRKGEKKELHLGQKVNYLDYSFWSDDFANIWKDFHSHRRTLKKHLTPKAEILNLNLIGKYSTSTKGAIELVEYSIANGWPSIYDPNDRRRSNGKAVGAFAEPQKSD